MQVDLRLHALKNNRGNITRAAVNKRVKATEDSDEEAFLTTYLAALDAVIDVSKTVKGGYENTERELADRLAANPDDEMLAELRVIAEYLQLTEQIAGLKKQIKDAEAELDDAAYAKYPELTVDEIKSLVVDAKWLTRLDADVHGEMDRISQSLTRRVKELAERYETPLPQLSDSVTDFEGKVNGHLRRMGFGVAEPQLAEVGT